MSSVQNQTNQRRNAEQHLPTATTLVSNVVPSQPTCCFCQKLHPPSKCTTVTQVEARKQILKRSGWCFCCLKRDHLSRECRSSIRSSNCKARHHTSICPGRPIQQLSGGAPSGTNLVQANVDQPHALDQARPLSILMLLLLQTCHLQPLPYMCLQTKQYSCRRRKLIFVIH